MTVLLVGDSNAYRSIPYAPSCLHIDGHPGYLAADRSWSTWISDDIATYAPDVVIVQLGTNDANHYVAAHRMGRSIDRIMDALGELPVRWNLVRRALRPYAHPVNKAIVRAQERYPNLSVGRLPEHFDGHPEWARHNDIHFTAAGYAEFVRWNLDAVAVSC